MENVTFGPTNQVTIAVDHLDLKGTITGNKQVQTAGITSYNFQSEPTITGFTFNDDLTIKDRLNVEGSDFLKSTIIDARGQFTNSNFFDLNINGGAQITNSSINDQLSVANPQAVLAQITVSDASLDGLNINIYSANSVEFVGGKASSLYVDQEMTGQMLFNNMEFHDVRNRGSLDLNYRAEFNNSSIHYANTQITGPIIFNNVDIYGLLAINHSDAKLHGIKLKNPNWNTLEVTKAHTLEILEGTIETNFLDLSKVQQANIVNLYILSETTGSDITLNLPREPTPAIQFQDLVVATTKLKIAGKGDFNGLIFTGKEFLVEDVGVKPSLRGLQFTYRDGAQLKILAAETLEVVGGTINELIEIINADNVSFANVTFINDSKTYGFNLSFDFVATFNNNIFRSIVNVESTSYFSNNTFELFTSIYNGIFNGDEFKATTHLEDEVTLTNTTHYEDLLVSSPYATIRNIRFIVDGHDEYDDQKIFVLVIYDTNFEGLTVEGQGSVFFKMQIEPYVPERQPVLTLSETVDLTNFKDGLFYIYLGKKGGVFNNEATWLPNDGQLLIRQK